MPETPTTDRLARALKAAGAPAAMVNRAASGYYDDYRSPLAFPITQLVCDLRALPQTGAIAALAAKAMEGGFDATKAEADAWAASPEGQEAFRDLVEGR
jgi:hypothetical protein